MDIDKAISAGLDQKLALEVNPAVMEEEPVEVPKLDLSESVEAEPAPEEVSEPQIEMKTVAQNAQAVQEAVANLNLVAKRYGFRPFSEAAAAVEQNFSALKSGIDRITV